MKTEQNKSQQQNKEVKSNSITNLDMFQKKNENITRYSDEELEEFRQLITDKLEASKKNYAQLKETIMLKGDNGTNDTSPTFNLMEDAGDLFSREEVSEHAVRQLKYIEHLENALVRVKNKTYGICHLTGKLISKERLRSVPHSTLSIDAKLGNLKV
jgi:DnaK suppressor protein